MKAVLDGRNSSCIGLQSSMLLESESTERKSVEVGGDGSGTVTLKNEAGFLISFSECHFMPKVMGCLLSSSIGTLRFS